MGHRTLTGIGSCGLTRGFNDKLRFSSEGTGRGQGRRWWRGFVVRPFMWAIDMLADTGSIRRHETSCHVSGGESGRRKDGAHQSSPCSPTDLAPDVRHGTSRCEPPRSLTIVTLTAPACAITVIQTVQTQFALLAKPRTPMHVSLASPCFTLISTSAQSCLGTAM